MRICYHKRTFLIFNALIFIAMCCWSCGNSRHNDTAGGNSYEILVLADENVWSGEAGDALRKEMARPVEMINGYEPFFDVLYASSRHAMPNMLRHRNILLLEADADVSELACSVQQDVYARPQTVVTIKAKTATELSSYMIERAENLTDIFETAERNRATAFNARNRNSQICTQIEEIFGMRIDIPDGYSVRKTANDFIWISNEKPLASLGIIIYAYDAQRLLPSIPAPGSAQEFLATEAIIKQRNEFVSLIPGPSPESYMTTSPLIVPAADTVTFSGYAWTRLRGFWDVENDFMGGPMINYSAPEETRGRIVTIDIYVYSPAEPQRNYLRELEHIASSAKLRQIYM